LHDGACFREILVGAHFYREIPAPTKMLTVDFRRIHCSLQGITAVYRE